MNKLVVGFVALLLLIVIAIGIMYTGGIQVGGNTFFGLEKLLNFQQNRQNVNPYADRRFMNDQNQGRSDSKMNSMNSRNPNGTMNTPPAVSQAPFVLKNIESLNKAMSQLNDAIKLIQLEPYADENRSSTSQNTSNSTGSATTESKSVSQGTSPQNGTVINIFPNNTTPDRMSAQSGMRNMGIHYDPVKMERLHSKLYKVAYGMELIRQLNDEFTMQTEVAGANLQNPAFYYQNFYNITITNKMKLNQALAYINEAEGLVNINPYISSDGLIFDRERMSQIHAGIFKLAEGVAQLTLLNGDLLKQSVSISNLYQNYLTTYSNDMGMNGSTSSSGNLDMRMLVNIIIVIFVIVLFVGLLGFIINLFKRN